MILQRTLLFILLLHVFRDIHSHLIANCDYKDTEPPQSQTDARAGVVVATHRTVMHSSSRTTLFFFHRLPGFIKPTVCRERTQIDLRT